jgi:hypothetical protein
MMHGIKFKRTKLNSVMAQWYIPWTSKQVLGFKPVFFSLANYHQISIFLKP